MHRFHGSNSCSARAVLAMTLGIICGLILAAPVLALHSWHRAAAILYLSFSPFCHQIPERSFLLFGHSLAVCHRCSGIYLGLLLGSLFNHAMHRSTQARRFWVFCAIAPMAIDVLAPAAGIWSNTSFTRFSTGLLFGILTSRLLVRGLSEFAQEAARQWPTLHNSILKGGLSWKKEC